MPIHNDVPVFWLAANELAAVRCQRSRANETAECHPAAVFSVLRVADVN